MQRVQSEASTRVASATFFGEQERGREVYTDRPSRCRFSNVGRIDTLTLNGLALPPFF